MEILIQNFGSLEQEQKSELVKVIVKMRTDKTSIFSLSSALSKNYDNLPREIRHTILDALTNEFFTPYIAVIYNEHSKDIPQYLKARFNKMMSEASE